MFFLPHLIAYLCFKDLILVWILEESGFSTENFQF